MKHEKNNCRINKRSHAYDNCSGYGGKAQVKEIDAKSKNHTIAMATLFLTAVGVIASIIAAVASLLK